MLALNLAAAACCRRLALRLRLIKQAVGHVRLRTGLAMPVSAAHPQTSLLQLPHAA